MSMEILMHHCCKLFPTNIQALILENITLAFKLQIVGFNHCKQILDMTWNLNDPYESNDSEKGAMV